MSSVLPRRNITLYVAGQGLSNIGTFAQIVAQSLLVLDLTGSSFDLGVVMAAQFLPMMLAGPWSGAWLDRVDLRRLLVFTSLIAGLEAVALGYLALDDRVTMTWLVGLSLLLGVAQLFDRPASQALLSELVPTVDLPRVVGIAGAAQAVGRLGGPAIAGVLYVWKGAGPTFFFNAASYLAVVLTMVLLRRRDMVPRVRLPRRKGQLREGWSFAWRSPLHRTTLVCNAIVGCLAFNFPLFYSSLVKLSLHASPSVFGLAESINALTAVAGGLWLGRRMSPPSTRTYALACLLLGLSLTWSALAPNTVLFLAGMPYFGFVVVYYVTVSQSLVQVSTPGHLVGRMMTLFTLGVMGTTPIGGLVSGWVTDAVSPRAAIGLGAASLFGCAAWVTLRHGEPLRAVPHEPASDGVPALAGAAEPSRAASA